MKKHKNNIGKAFVAIAMTLLVSVSAAVANNDIARSINLVETITTEVTSDGARLGYIDYHWDEIFGGDQSDYGYSVEQTSDGGYILAGYTDSFGAGGYDGWLVKTDGSGVEQWNVTFGGTGADYGYSVEQTSDGGYILAGYTDSFGAGAGDGWLIKTDATGTMQWNATLGDIGTDKANSVDQTTDGGYILTGSTKSYGATLNDVWLVKTNASGNEQWHTIWVSAYDDYGYSVQQTTDSGYIVVATDRGMSPHLYSGWLIKTDVNGTEQWSKLYYGTGTSSYLYSVQQTSDGYICVGKNTYPWVLKVDADGTVQYSKNFQLPNINNGVGRSVQQTMDGYIVGGYVSSSDGSGYNALLLKLAYFFNLSTHIEGSGTLTRNPAGDSYMIGTIVDINAFAAPLWEFSHWSGDATGSDNPLTLTMNNDMNITAHFTEIEYTLTIQTAGYGTVTKDPDQSTYAPGTEVELTANPNPGWMFSHWSGDLTGSDNPATITMTDDKVVVASFIMPPELVIGNITGGLFKIQAKIFNDGIGDALDVEWNITLTPTLGILIRGQETTGTVLRIPAMGTAVVTSDIILGIGKVDITVSATIGTETLSKTVPGFVLGFYIKI